jgi:hypothetical protein
MTTIGFPPRTPEQWDVPPARLAADMASLVDRQRLERELSELRAHARQRLAERGTTPLPEHWDQWHEWLDIDPDLRGRDYGRPGGAR